MSISWPLYLSAIGFVLIAALPGRTTFLMILMSARGRPWIVFSGALLAFGLQSLISVLLGNLLSFLPAWVIQVAAALLFLYFAFHFWQTSEKHDLKEDQAVAKPHSIRSVFLIIFAAEWGDVSQVAIASFSANNPERLTVFLGATTALWTIAGASVILGSLAGKTISARLIQRMAAVAFVAIALYLFAEAAGIRLAN